MKLCYLMLGLTLLAVLTTIPPRYAREERLVAV